MKDPGNRVYVTVFTPFEGAISVRAAQRLVSTFR